MKYRDRMLIYFKAACIAAIVVPLSLPLLYFLFCALPDPMQRAIFCCAAKPVFFFGNIVNARLGDLIILYVFYWILLGMVAVLGTVWLYMRLLHRDGGRRRDYIVVALIFGAIVTSVILWTVTSDRRVFSKYVDRPIPQSVKGIKAHHPWEVSGHRYVMHFRISKTDAEQIIRSRPFRQVDHVSCTDGRLRWGQAPPWEKVQFGQPNPFWEEGGQLENMSLYSPGDGKSGPKWFKLDRWENPRVYAFKERTASDRGHRQIFIFNEELAEAYFVEYLSGTW